ncbi:biotin/lipoate A/B protein ligase family protein [Geitlerinema sp. PCC 9228]|uniref:lipoate--protein ligase family protein n=1 Tax=Geitlerinema sp. PCC 9228 TaxID=111611 RepID=UPI0008F98883|nr:biotin/lipoate A/B protein ligase family protein [Geitlerinema sp. PCC 9228]
MAQKPSVWRLIPWLKASGQVQMAIDRWLLQQQIQGSSMPTLRFYTWYPPTISLGYHQRYWDRAWNDILYEGIPLDSVRRPTGGRAVLHQGDLTYAVAVPSMEGKTMEIYQHLCEFLIAGWRSLGVSLEYGQAGRNYIRNDNCFATSTGADLVLENGAKFIGSAQVRKETSVLQHGSMLLNPDKELFAEVFGQDAIASLPDWKFIVSHAESLKSKSFENAIAIVIDALTSAAARSFGIELVTQPLSESEWVEIFQWQTQFDR